MEVRTVIGRVPAASPEFWDGAGAVSAPETGPPRRRLGRAGRPCRGRPAGRGGRHRTRVQVAVAVQGEAHRGMPGAGGDFLGVGAGRDPSAGADPGRRMPAAAALACSAAPAAAIAALTPSTRPAAHERARRRYDGLHAKAGSTRFPEEAAACRARPSSSGQVRHLRRRAVQGRSSWADVPRYAARCRFARRLSVPQRTTKKKQGVTTLLATPNL
jgi:hypothetical protein